MSSALSDSGNPENIAFFTPIYESKEELSTLLKKIIVKWALRDETVHWNHKDKYQLNDTEIETW